MKLTLSCTIVFTLLFSSVYALASDINDLNNIKTNKLKILKLIHCDKTNTCPEDNSDPRNSQYLLAEKIVEQIEQSNKLNSKKKLKDKQAVLRVYQSILIETLSFRSEFVQLKSIECLSKINAHADIFKAISDNFLYFKEKKLVTLSLKEFKRYPDNESKIDLLLAQALKTGSFSAAKVISKKANYFLRNGNIEFYKALVIKLPSKSQKRKYLENNINAFMRGDK